MLKDQGAPHQQKYDFFSLPTSGAVIFLLISFLTGSLCET